MKLTEDQVRRAWADRCTGIPARQIAAGLGVHKEALRQRWVRLGLHAPAPAAPPLLGSEVAAIAREVATGNVSMRTAAEVRGRCVTHVRDVLRARAVPRPRGPLPQNRERDRKLVGLLIDGASWPEVIAALGLTHESQKVVRARLCEAAKRYCAREEIPLPPAALAHLPPRYWSRRPRRSEAA